MKIIFFFCLIQNFLLLNAQTSDDLFEYFPMQIGNVFCYQIIEYDFFNDDTLSISYRTYEITGDTILTDGFLYNIFSIDNNYVNEYYYRIDTANLLVYNDYFCEYKLDAKHDSTWIDCGGIVTYISIDTSFVGILGIERPQIIFQQGFGFFNRTLSKGFGLSFSEEGDLGHHYRNYLVYAKIDGVEYGTLVGVPSKKNNKQLGFRLFQNYPNPFNPVTTIEYSIPYVETQHTVSLKIIIYDVLGKEVATLVDGIKKPGKYKVHFDASHLTSGVYFYKIISGEFVETKKLVLLK